MNRLLLLVSIVSSASFAACTNDKVTPPSPTPPPSWGVPITGGTMAISHDGNHAIVSDPDRDRVVIVDLTKQTSVVTALNDKDQPGRVVEDNAGNFHVALRGGGALVDFNTAGTILGRRAVCAEPRGVAHDALIGLLPPTSRAPAASSTRSRPRPVPRPVASCCRATSGDVIVRRAASR